MDKPTLDTLSQPEFEESVDRYIHWASEWDGALPADVFFGIWADFQPEKHLVELHAHIVAGQRTIESVLARNDEVDR